MIKKGQAAMEFLMTYGWAILAAIVAIGVLAYFGVFNSGSLVTGNAIVNAPFHLYEWNVQSNIGTDGGVNLEIINGGVDSEIDNIDISGCGTFIPGVPQVAPANSKTSFQILCNPGTSLVESNTFKGDIKITYRKKGSSLGLTSTGTITQKITA